MSRILAIEPWFGETHRLFLENWAKYSRHEIHLLTLPPRKWKWRMRAGSLIIIDQIRQFARDFDAVLVSDYVNLAELVGLDPGLFNGKFLCSYFHENQLTYPVQKQSERDYAFALANIMTIAASHKIIWNTRFHLEDFLLALPAFLNVLPDPRPQQIEYIARKRSLFIPVGLELEPFEQARLNRQPRKGKPIRILWSHRWEHDKNPEDFFHTLFELKEEGLNFELTVLGKSYSEVPPIFNTAKDFLRENIVRFGYIHACEYAAEIAACDVVVSTSLHENQGLAVIEAIAAGCDPLLPNRLSYPEILPQELHEKHLYDTNGELRRILRWMMKHPDRVRFRTHENAVKQFAIQVTAKKMDTVFESSE
ncbi:DUF3524 domain-containing protein [candidate division KSB1 bacterium]|nr:DUF3524 domain-containing protein [candidate division KSB1 bacterium]